MIDHFKVFFTMKIILMSGFLLFSQIIFSQNIKFIGSIEYASEKLTPAGDYKETSKSNTYFAPNVHCYEQIQKMADIEKAIDEHTESIISRLTKYNNWTDTIEIAKQRKKYRLRIEESYKKIETTVLRIFVMYDRNIATTLRKIGNQGYCLTDSIKKTNWELLQDTMTIEGLFCQKAKGMFGAKFYEVWFTPSISFGAGPLVMHGLPGVIIMATREDKKIRYKMTKIEYPLAKPLEYTGCTNENVISKNQMLELQEKNKKEKLQKIKEEIKKNSQ